MKSVIDAVIEFKGEVVTGAYYVVCRQSVGSIHWWTKPSLDDLATPQWSELCTATEFNQCIQELSTNFGRSVTYAEYKAFRAAHKHLNKGDKISCYVCHVGAYPMQQYCGSCGHELLSENKESNMIKFDLEKALAGEKVIGADGIEIKQISEFKVSGIRNIGAVREGRLLCLSCDELFMAPKLEDGEAYQFDYLKGVIGMQGAIMRYREAGDYFHFNNTIFNREHCTNIIKLIPEVK